MASTGASEHGRALEKAINQLDHPRGLVLGTGGPGAHFPEPVTNYKPVSRTRAEATSGMRKEGSTREQ